MSIANYAGARRDVRELWDRVQLDYFLSPAAFERLLRQHVIKEPTDDAAGSDSLMAKREYLRPSGDNVLLHVEQEACDVHVDGVVTRLLYSISCEYPRDALSWYWRLQPDLHARDAPVNNFVLHVPDATAALEARAAAFFERLRASSHF